MLGLEICGIGSYLPDTIVDNEAYTNFIDTSDEWIRSRSGITTRHIGNGETTWRMGALAAKRALDDAGMKGEEIGAIIVTSVTPDYMTPSASCIIQGELNAMNALCIDVNCACAAFVYGLDMARRYLACDDIKNVLLISSELLTRMVNYADRSTCILFGDGAGAVVLKAAPGKLFTASLGADGKGYATIFTKNPPHTTPFTHEQPWTDEILESEHGVGLPTMRMFMNGPETYKFASRVLPMCLKKACEKAGIEIKDLDWIVPHQANIRISRAAMKNLGLKMDKVYMTIDHTGNTSSASIPIALDEMKKKRLLARGQKLGFAGFGAGLIYGGAVLEY